MAKSGLDYFPLACNFEDKIELIEAEFGLRGIAIIVKLYQKIYGEFGYYCDWNDEVALLFSRKACGLKEGDNVVSEVVKAAFKRGVFDKDMFDKYGIITSAGIQKRYFEAKKRNVQIEVEETYLLLSTTKIPKNANIISKNVCRNEKNVCRNQQSKVKESKEKNKNTMCTADAHALFESLWKLYPEKKGKGKVSDAAKRRLLQIGFDEMSRAIDRYKAELEKDKDWRKTQNGSTFFNSGYVDYLDENYVPGSTRKPSGPTAQFNQFMQNDYDFEQLEKEIVSN